MGRSWRFDLAKVSLIRDNPSHIRAWIDRIETRGVEHLDEGDQSHVSTRREADTARTNPGLSVLSRRELEVLELAASNHNNEDIARKLFISIPTVKTHMTHILRKLGQKTRIGAILEYQHLADPSPPAPQPQIHPRYDSSEPHRN
jgi:DNA-binding CsgD family transcriptional regulator